MKKLQILSLLGGLLFTLSLHGGNPIIRDRFTADPAALVHDGKVYLYVGNDEAATGGSFYVLNQWLIYSSADLVNWELEGSMPRAEFAWARGASAWAAQAIERDGKFYWYVTVLNRDPDWRKAGNAIAVAVSDHPTKGFRDALGGPLVRSDMTEAPEFMQRHGQTWDDIDPTVFIDDRGQAYLYWGNVHLYFAKLKSNMIELDGEIQRIEIQGMPGTFTEAPWIHRHNGNYYLSFAMNFPEQIAYATSDSLEGPWTYRGLLMDLMPGTGTNHQAIIEFKGQWYFIHHSAALPTGGDYRRSVHIEKFTHNPDGTINTIIATASGIAFDPYFLQTHRDSAQYIRHANFRPGLSELDPDNYDFKWHVVPGLGEGEGELVSFQAENWPGHYLRIYSDGGLTLSKHDASDDFKRRATFRRVPGLADKTWSSFETVGELETRYLQIREDGAVRVGRLDQNNPSRATFRLVQVKADR
jgi:hypothetical protein